MLTWTETGSDGAEVLVRSGRGTVKAVSGLGDRTDPTDMFSYGTYRVEIAVEPAHVSTRAIRVRIAPILQGDSPLVAAAVEAVRSKTPVTFAIEFVRKPHVPKEVSVTALDLSRDMSARLRSLDPEHLTVDASTESSFRGV